MTYIDVDKISAEEFLKYFYELASTKILLTGVPLHNLNDKPGKKILSMKDYLESIRQRPSARYARVRATDIDNRKYYYDIEIDETDRAISVPEKAFWNDCLYGFMKISGRQRDELKHIHVREIGFEVPKNRGADTSNIAIITINNNRLAYSVGGRLGQNKVSSIIYNAVQESRLVQR